MDETDKVRLFRRVKLSVKDLETIAQAVSYAKTVAFRQGWQAEVEHMTKLLAKIKKNIEKEQP